MIDPAIRKLLRGPLDTFEKLEVGVALFRAPARTMSMTELAAIGLGEEQLRRGIDDLVHAKLASDAGGVVRLTVRAADEPALRALADLHARDPSMVAHEMSEVALDKIRSMAAHAFAQAFQAHKKP